MSLANTKWDSNTNSLSETDSIDDLYTEGSTAPGYIVEEDID